MSHDATDLPPPVNHIFVDYENVQAIDPAIIGNKTVHLTLLLGARQTKLDVLLVEKLLHHAATVELIRLQSSGRNALDFALAYYIGRAVATDPAGYFHIISKDTGYDPLIEHLRSKHIRIRRHDDFTTLTFSVPAKPAAGTSKPTPPPAVSKPKVVPKPKVQPSAKTDADDLEKRILEHLRKPTATRPRTKTKLASFLIAHLGQQITKSEALTLIENLGQAGHLFIDDKDKVTYHLKPF
jgi:hypothetical protein